MKSIVFVLALISVALLSNTLEAGTTVQYVVKEYGSSDSAIVTVNYNGVNGTWTSSSGDSGTITYSNGSGEWRSDETGEGGMLIGSRTEGEWRNRDTGASGSFKRKPTNKSTTER